MTEPDLLAELAAQIDELRGQLARSQGEIGVIRARLDTGSGLEATLRLEIKKLRRRLDEADKRWEAAPDAPWWVVDQAEGEAMLTELRSWVDGFLRRHYPGYLAALRPCWVNHPEAVWELSTLQAEWIRIYADEQNRELKGALAWHDRWLPGVLARLKTSIRCDESGCRIPRR